MRISTAFGAHNHGRRVLVWLSLVALVLNLMATSVAVNAQGNNGDNNGGGSDPPPPPAPQAPSNSSSSSSSSSSSTTSSTISRSTTSSSTTSSSSSRSTTSSSTSASSAASSTAAAQPTVVLTDAGAQPTTGTAAERPVTTAIVIEPNGQIGAFSHQNTGAESNNGRVARLVAGGVALAVAGMQLV